jgi:hypothetical protein
MKSYELQPLVKPALQSPSSTPTAVSDVWNTNSGLKILLICCSTSNPVAVRNKFSLKMLVYCCRGVYYIRLKFQNY